MASDLLESYIQQFSNNTAEIISTTTKIPSLYGSEKQQAISHVEKLFEESRELLEQMEIETREIPLKDRDRYQTRLKSYHAELSKLEKDLKRARYALSDEVHMREELFTAESDIQQTEDQRARLLDNCEQLERSGHRLEQSYKTCIETEQMGTQILDDLHSQRNVIQRARERLHDTNEQLGKSSRILSGMMRRALQNKALLVIFAIVILTVVATAIYLAVRRH